MKAPVGPCHIFTGSLRPGGRAPQVKRNGVQKQAYHWAYVDKYGPYDEGLELDHLCNQPACINADHLEPVTGVENRRRARLRNLTDAAGHAWTDENTYIDPRGNRHCRVCAAERCRRYRERKRTPLNPGVALAPVTTKRKSTP